MNLDYPFNIAPHGRVQLTDEERYLDRLIEQALFTIPGERLNRPEFGCNILGLVHQNPDEAQIVTTRFMIEVGLRRSVGDEVDIAEVDIEVRDESLSIRVVYNKPNDKQPRTLEFNRNMAN